MAPRQRQAGESLGSSCGVTGCSWVFTEHRLCAHWGKRAGTWRQELIVPSRSMDWCRNVRLGCHNLLIKGNIQCGMVPRGSVYTGGKRKHTALSYSGSEMSKLRLGLGSLWGNGYRCPGLGKGGGSRRGEAEMLQRPDLSRVSILEVHLSWALSPSLPAVYLYQARGY